MFQQSFFKEGDDATLGGTHEVCVWKTGKCPNDWTNSIFILLLEKTISCSVRTTERLLRDAQHANTIMLRIILERIRTKIDNELSDEQAEFPKTGKVDHWKIGTGTQEDHPFNLRVIKSQAQIGNIQSLLFCSVDCTKTFESAFHKKL